MEKVRYMISDAANIVHVESHVLRYWEDELELNIPRNEMGHRYYTKENIAEFQRIKELKEQGYQLKAIRMIVHNGPIEGLTAEAPLPVGQAPLSAGAAAAIPQPVQPVAAQMAAVTQPVQPVAPQQLPVKNTTESPQSILNNTDKMAQFTELMTEIVGKALAANNEELGQSISEEVGKQVIKEMNYLMRERRGRGGPLPQAGCCDSWKHPQKGRTERKETLEKEKAVTSVTAFGYVRKINPR